ncbi:MAG: C-terminal binding protein [Acidimicrobiia bacterium]
MSHPVEPIRLVVAAGTFVDLSDVKSNFEDVAIEELNIGETPDSLAQAVVGARGLAVALHPLQREDFEVLKGQIEIIGRAGIGLDSIDLEAARDAGIAVVHQPIYATNEVATHAVAMLLAVNRRLAEADRLARSGWHGRSRLGVIQALDEESVGVVGCGRIGRAVIDRLRPFAREIVVYDPFADSFPEGTRPVTDIADLLSACRYVTLHLPLNPQTRELISREAIMTMPAGSVLVNVSRGGLVDETALADALKSGHLAGAALDVMADEPPDENHPLFSSPNLLLSSHIAWYSSASEQRLKHQTMSDMVSYLRGRSVIGRLAVDPRTEAMSNGIKAGTK